MADEIPADFQELFRLHYPRVVRTLRSLIAAPDAVEDLAQEVFVRLYRHPPDDPSKVAPWLHRTCTRMAYDYLRAVHRHRRTLEQMEHAEGTEEATPSSEHVVLQDWERTRVQGVLRQMSERDRKALWLRHSGYSYREIADYLQVPKEQVGTLLIRAAARFKKLYQEGGPARGEESSVRPIRSSGID
ncbi:sigma-70 family RNA polymerase sigma factor [Kyrpidia tusciae]|uniref:RNA polymerase, sigma-24 subunit, ECF subfamily n=1 Tax=Kyrpidia tusciae (strain DSM 2912 / NBRC 15312 / T2) TaxID=562970 RepID=D5WTZ0_KYRT2|nr:sigma-70 family RNA polymerase sigma factor [Kyrpidia tusciae]ADG05310.1 RNA polymerase, sigma-24 subunit, ECF subfamily [Kyrpidia tusciae DSM 2912]